MYKRFGQNDTNLKDENATKVSLADARRNYEGPRNFYITLVGLGSHRIFVQLLSRRSSDKDFCCSRPPAPIKIMKKPFLGKRVSLNLILNTRLLVLDSTM